MCIIKHLEIYKLKKDAIKDFMDEMINRGKEKTRWRQRWNQPDHKLITVEAGEDTGEF